MAGIGDSAAAIWLSVVVALANFTFAVVGVFLIERYGRRPLLLGSLIGRTTLNERHPSARAHLRQSRIRS